MLQVTAVPKTGAWAWVLVGLAAAGACAAAEPELRIELRGVRSLSEANRRLCRATGWLISLEEPLWPPVQRGGPEARQSFFGGLEQPPEPDRVAVAFASLRGAGARTRAVNELLAAYNSQNPGRLYRAMTIGAYTVLLPGGAQTETVLSLPIRVPVARRSAEGHFQEIARSVGQAAGIPVDIGMSAVGFYLNRAFSARDDAEFEWGTANVVVARQALVDLLAHSQTSLSWLLNCQVGVGGSVGRCSLSPIPRTEQIRDRKGRITERILYFDRGPGPAIPPPPPPPPPPGE